MSKQFFGIQFEDYSLPEGLPMPKTYYGTLHQIKAVMDDLAADPITAAKYASTIQAFEEYTEGFLGATHEISGQRLSLLTPVQLIHETMIVEENAQWYFNNGVYQHLVRAECMYLHQVLLRDGDMYLRCVRPSYAKVQYDNPYEGWTSMPPCHYGFPYMYVVENGWHSMRLYTLEQVELSAEPCLIRMHDACHVSHHVAGNDLFGGRGGSYEK